MTRCQDRLKRRFTLLNQFLPVTMIASTTPGTHNPRISAQTVINRLREIGERPPIQCMFYMRRFFFGLVYMQCVPNIFILLGVLNVRFEFKHKITVANSTLS